MDRDGSGVSVLLGLDGLVMGAQLLEEASGEWWLAVETLEDRPGARPAACGRWAMAAAGSWCGTCRWRIARWYWWGPSGCALQRAGVPGVHLVRGFR